jgi:hypothetical protein
MKKFVQCCTKITCKDINELCSKINALEAASEYPISVSPSIANRTDTNFWYNVFYYKQVANDENL